MEQLISELNEYFVAHAVELLKKYDGKVLVISENKEITPFDDFKSGYDFGLKQYGYGKFLLKECSMPAINSVHVINPIIAVV